MSLQGESFHQVSISECEISYTGVSNFGINILEHEPYNKINANELALAYNCLYISNINELNSRIYNVNEL